MFRTSRTFLYVAKFSDLVKVGTSVDPERRAQSIGGVLVLKVEVDRDKVAATEAYAHHLLVEHEQSSEWFTCSMEMAINAVKTAMARLGEGLSLETPDRMANQRRGLILAAQRKADRTDEKLRVALTMWFDEKYTVKQVAEACGLSRGTLYDRLPPRRTLYDHLPPRRVARERKRRGPEHA